MDGFWIIIAVMVGVTIFVFFVVAGQRYREEERRNQLRAVAEAKGFRFSAEASDALWGAVRSFHLFSQGRGRTIENVLEMDVGDVAVSIFDYRYTTGSGNHRHTHRQTVALFQSDRLRLPRFTLRPEGLLHKVGGLLGYQDVDFKGNAAFSDAYLLQGDDEPRIRAVFSKEVLAYYARHSGLCTEAEGQRLVYYRARQRVAAEEIDSFVKDGLDVVDLFREQDDVLDEMAQLDAVLEDAQSVLGGRDSTEGA